MSELSFEEREHWTNHVLAKDKIKDCEGHDSVIEKLLNELERRDDPCPDCEHTARHNRVGGCEFTEKRGRCECLAYPHEGKRNE